MFIGIDHGTTAMRFAGETREFKLSREAAKDFHIADLARICPVDEIDGIAVCYSMGDNFSKITRIEKLQNRGLVSREGAGKHIGGGTRVFDEVAASGIPTIAIPGLHRGSPTDPRFKAYSHQTSPEKIGIAYGICQDLGKRRIGARLCRFCGPPIGRKDSVGRIYKGSIYSALFFSRPRVTAGGSDFHRNEAV